MLASGVVEANSNKLVWNQNGHFYQRFDAVKNWSEAKAACVSVGAHLATITSVAENDFIKLNLLVNTPPTSEAWYFIGATDSASQLNFKWVTGEAWNYSNWYSNEPDNNTDEDYLVIGDDDYSGYYGYWFDVYSSDLESGYLCEWETNNYIGVASVPDLNGNGWAEDATLYVDFKTTAHTVKIKDPQTHATISTLTFVKNQNPPQGLAVLEDMNGNSQAEIAVLTYDASYRLARVKIKDAKNNAAYIDNGNLTFLTPDYVPIAITTVPDKNGNGSSEITVLGKHRRTGATKSETRDAETGALLGSNLF